MTTLDSDQVRSLDQTRQLLLSLHTSLVALRSDISQNPQLPSWPALQTHANLISNNLQTITDSLSKHRETFSSAVVNPLPQFPGKERAFILETLLRTKLEPSVEEWIEEGETVATQQQKSAHRGLSTADRDALWQWAPGAANAEARKQKWGADYTLQEIQNGIENVKTGLLRELVEPPEDDDVDDDDEDEYDEVTDDETGPVDKMDIEPLNPDPKSTSPAQNPPLLPRAPQMSMESMHKFMTTGR
ncbi:hypothetical protein LTR84_009248 [Exophiala bonariae]|uniref:Mediator of RNA polymerase II transcription subunit 8 n=1 Tax=Exophiala bonariae TaxID=1690606 RepID=A0AAV9MVI5_9EURO|nr:hypothetical protein LTR84_009248 [Exophiala bonariae]